MDTLHKVVLPARINVGDRTIDPWLLWNLPPTSAIERQTLDIGTKIQHMEAMGDGRAVAYWTHRLQEAQGRLTLARARDTLNAGRPDGCWCFGLGGRGHQAVPTDPPVEIFREFCQACPEGRAALMHAEAAWDGYEARVAAHKSRARMVLMEIPPKLAGCTFATYPVSKENRGTWALVKAWAESDETRGLCLWGASSRGKTGLMVAALQRRAERHPELIARYLCVPEWLTAMRLHIAEQRPGESLAWEWAVRADLLLVDDIGQEKATDWAYDRIYTLVNHRHARNLTTLFTTNATMEKLAEHMSEAVAWRIAEMAAVKRLVGPNLRRQSDGAQES